MVLEELGQCQEADWALRVKQELTTFILTPKVKFKV